MRKSNADQYLIVDMSRPFDAVRHDSARPDPASMSSRSHGHLMFVADGIGSGAGGEFASRLIVDMAQDYLNTQSGRREDDRVTLGHLVALLHRCQRGMNREATRSDNWQIGTTLTAACVLGSTLHVLHAGDSRCYLIRDGKLRLLTTDHNLAQQMVEQRFLTPATARESGLQHVLWNAITADSPTFTLETVARKLRSGDLLLLCTDGLTKHLTDADILGIADRPDDAPQITRRLVDTAMAGGGTDNITVVVARYQPLPAAPVPSPTQLETDRGEADSWCSAIERRAVLSVHPAQGQGDKIL